MAPKREDVDSWMRRNQPVCDYCVHSTENFPNKEQEGAGRLWCMRRQEIVMGSQNVCQDYEF